MIEEFKTRLKNLHKIETNYYVNYGCIVSEDDENGRYEHVIYYFHDSIKTYIKNEIKSFNAIISNGNFKVDEIERNNYILDKYIRHNDCRYDFETKTLYFNHDLCDAITKELKYKMDLKNLEIKEIIKYSFKDIDIDFIEINNFTI